MGGHSSGWDAHQICWKYYRFLLHRAKAQCFTKGYQSDEMCVCVNVCNVCFAEQPQPQPRGERLWAASPLLTLLTLWRWRQMHQNLIRVLCRGWWTTNVQINPQPVYEWKELRLLSSSSLLCAAVTPVALAEVRTFLLLSKWNAAMRNKSPRSSSFNKSQITISSPVCSLLTSP